MSFLFLAVASTSARLDIRSTLLRRAAYKIWVDIDPAELHRPTIQPDMPITADAKEFLLEMNRQLSNGKWDTGKHANWLAWCKERQARYPAVLPKHRTFNGKINPYHFMEILFDQLNKDDVIVTGNASACIVPFQVAKL